MVLKNKYVANQWVNHTHEVIENSLFIEKAAIDMETGMRGFLLAGKEEFLEPYESGKVEFDRLIKKLKIKVADNPPQVEKLINIDKHMLEWRRVIVTPSIKLRRSVGLDNSMSEISELVGKAHGKKYFDAFREKIKYFRDVEVDLMHKRQSTSEKTFAFLVILVGLTTVTYIFFLFGLSFLITKPFKMVFGDLTKYSYKQLEEFQSTFKDMEKSKEKIDTILKNSPGAICQFTIDLKNQIKFEYFSDQAYVIFEITPHDFDLEPWLIIDMIHEQDKDALIENVVRSSQTMNSFHWEGWINTKSNKTKYLKLESAPLKNNNGLIIWNGILIDITKEKILEKDLAHQNKLVEHSSRLAAIGELSSGITHEINNPLAIVLLKLDDLKDKIDEKYYSDIEINQCFEYIDDAINRVSNITNSLRYFANPNSKYEISDIGNEVKLSLSLIKELYRNNGIKLQYNEPKEELFILSPPTYVHQVTMNLVSNAKDALEGSENPTILIYIHKENEFACLKVEDNGPGIPSDIQTNILEPFFTTKEANKGTGIGLSMCNSLVSRVGGNMSFKSSDRGTIFECKFRLSIDKDAEKSNNNSTTQIELIKQKDSLKVLLVDDEPHFINILANQLEKKGFEVVLSNDAISALKILNRESFDIIISDQNMPKMKGSEFFQEVMKIKLGNDAIKILMSGNSMPIENIKNSDFLDEFISKPFKLSCIIDLLVKKI